MDNIDARDALLAVGLGMLSVGVGAYDWRLGLIVCGVVLMIGWAAPYLRRGK
jgi:hypothetical protein